MLLYYFKMTTDNIMVGKGKTKMKNIGADQRQRKPPMALINATISANGAIGARYSFSVSANGVIDDDQS